MNEQIIERASPLDAFGKGPAVESTSLVPAGVFAGPAERVFGAQPVAVHRDENAILAKIKMMAAAAGEYWYYRYPVKKRNDDGTFATDWIEGPSIKCANAVSRMYGNCDVDTRVFDVGDSYMFYARFMDLETGYSLVRPYRQRKGQKTMKTDAGRAEDIVFQIGASKAIRNVINNALDFFTNFAKDEAKASIIETVGKKIEFYREKIAKRLAELKIDIKRVEVVRGRALKDWLAADMALTIAELQAIQDGMATAGETYPAAGENGDAEGEPQTAQTSTELNKFAEGKTEGQAANGNETANGNQASPQSTHAAGQPAPETSQSSQAAEQQGAGAAAAADSKPAESKAEDADKAAPGKAPTTEAEYIAYAHAWRNALTDADAGEKRWKDEKKVRNKCNVSPENRDELEKALKAKVAQLRKG